MSSRWIKLLLLASFAFWASGAALYAHERLEHGSGDDHDEAAIAPADLIIQGGSTAASRHGHHHDHDKCPTCQLLSMMKVGHVAQAPLPFIARTSFPNYKEVYLRPLVVDVRSFLPIRGPPATDSI